MTKEYLKMADVFTGCVIVRFSTELRDGCGFICDAEDDDQAKYISHAINSHDELVDEVERLRGAIQGAFIDGCQAGWDMTCEGCNAEYGGPDNDRLHEGFSAIFTERYADK